MDVSRVCSMRGVGARLTEVGPAGGFFSQQDPGGVSQLLSGCAPLSAHSWVLVKQRPEELDNAVQPFLGFCLEADDQRG